MLRYMHIDTDVLTPKSREVPESLAFAGTITRRCEWNDPPEIG